MPHALFYDGVCGLCDGFTRFVLVHDQHDRFRFAPLQSAYARDTLVPHGVDPTQLDTVVVLTDDGKILARSDAVLFVLHELGGFWRLLSSWRWVPRVLRDSVYGFVARHRLAWFGQLDACRIPTPEERSKFIAE